MQPRQTEPKSSISIAHLLARHHLARQQREELANKDTNPSLLSIKIQKDAKNEEDRKLEEMKKVAAKGDLATFRGPKTTRRLAPLPSARNKEVKKEETLAESVTAWTKSLRS